MSNYRLPANPPVVEIAEYAHLNVGDIIQWSGPSENVAPNFIQHITGKWVVCTSGTYRINTSNNLTVERSQESYNDSLNKILGIKK